MKEVLIGIISAFFSSVLFFSFQLIFFKVKQKKEGSSNEDRSIKDGLQALLMADLETKHDIYMQKGSASFREKKMYEKEYTSYHNLGDNGVMTSAYKEVMSLPTADE